MATQVCQVSGAELQAAINYSWRLGDSVYAVVDAARDHELVRAARHELGLKVDWLFYDNAAAHMSEVAPYLIAVRFQSRYPFAGSEYLDLWAKHLGNRAGILLLAPIDTDGLRDHLRELFHVTDAEQHKYYFRFYDPRVLWTYLPTCTAAEAKEFFGPIHRILVESQESGRMCYYLAGGSGVEAKEVTLGSVAKSRSRRRYRQ